MLSDETDIKQHVLKIRNLNYVLEKPHNQNLSNEEDSSKNWLILKNINLEIKSGEVTVLLGTQGSGKSCLLNSIAITLTTSLVSGMLLGDITLDGAELNEINFCDIGTIIKRENDSYLTNTGYYSKNVELLSQDCNGTFITPFSHLSAREVLNYNGKLKISNCQDGYHINRRILDLVKMFEMTTFMEKSLQNLTEYERVVFNIVVHLVSDPVIILLETPLLNLDHFPANTILTKLSQYCKKGNKIVIMSLQRARSDLNLLIDNIIYLSRGEVVYYGPVKIVNDYFNAIGFHCPEFENPLNYYLYLCSIDYRSTERFLETSVNLEKIIECYKAYKGDDLEEDVMSDNETISSLKAQSKVINMSDISRCHLSKNETKANVKKRMQHTSLLLDVIIKILFRYNFTNFYSCAFQMIYSRNYLNLLRNWPSLSFRLFLFPICTFVLLIFRIRIDTINLDHRTDDQSGFQSRLGTLFYILFIQSALSLLNTVNYVDEHRRVFLGENKSRMYGGGVFILYLTVSSLPINILSSFLGSSIIYWFSGFDPEPQKYIMFSAVLLVVCSFVEIQTILIMNHCKDLYNVFETGLFLLIISIISSSGFLRVYNHLPYILNYLTYLSVYRYAGHVLAINEFSNLHLNCQSTCILYNQLNDNLVSSIEPSYYDIIDNMTMSESELTRKLANKTLYNTNGEKNLENSNQENVNEQVVNYENIIDSRNQRKRREVFIKNQYFCLIKHGGEYLQKGFTTSLDPIYHIIILIAFYIMTFLVTFISYHYKYFYYK
ncbi:unnamed protein product [Gordionus sp. m RMFG-2023]